MSANHLIDASALIALTYTDHEHHESAQRWVTSVDGFAICPIVEGALVRFLLRVGETQTTAVAVLDVLHASGRIEFWPDAVSYGRVDLSHVVGHRQVTDAYLASLAAHHGARLATFDIGLARALPMHVDLIATSGWTAPATRADK